MRVKMLNLTIRIKKIDRTILKVLGFTVQSADGLLAYLYPALTKEIGRLKTMMGA